MKELMYKLKQAKKTIDMLDAASELLKELKVSEPMYKLKQAKKTIGMLDAASELLKKFKVYEPPRINHI